MANGRSQFIAALDVGSSKISCAVAQPLDDGYRVLGAASRRAEGLRRGVITDMDAAEAAIRDVVDQAEQRAGVALEDVFVSLSGGMPSSHVAEVEIAAPDRPITDQDVRRLLQLAGTREEQGERSVLHAIPVGFALDGETGIQDPRGMVGRRLSARVHLLSAAQGAQRNLKMCIERCLLRPVDLVAAPYAAGLGCLSWDARDLGSVVIDLGAGVTKIGIFRSGTLIFADAIPIGSAHITNDIASIPGLTLAFGVGRLGMLFAALASALWIVNSVYSIGYMRGNNEKNQTRFYVCFAVAISAVMGVAFADNLLTLFLCFILLPCSIVVSYV